jgi:two-component system sensor histidine kinase CpxA
MRTLFIKIFLWFWLAMAMLIGVTFLITAVTQPDMNVTPGRRAMQTASAIYAQTSIRAFEKDGPAAVEEIFARIDKNANLKATLLDENGKVLVGSPLSPDLAKSVLPGGAELVFDREKMATVRRVASEDGKKYIFVTAFDRNLLPFIGVSNRTRAIRFLATVLTGGLVCYGLAKYLTSPLARLRVATQQFADGKLSTRIGPAIGKRRDEAADLARDFDVMAERIELLVNSQKRLLGDISHELRSPLARLTVALELARRRSGPDAFEYLKRIEQESERLNELIGELLSLARMESESGVLNPETIDMAEFIQGIADDVDFEAQASNRSVNLVGAPTCRVNGSSELLRRAVENVARNALHHTPEGTAVEIAVSCKNGRVTIGVRDFGTGVPEGDLKNIFKPFYRVADARERATGGVGLGLAIAQRAVSLHGGEISARNLDRGLMVEIRLPNADVG